MKFSKPAYPTVYFSEEVWVHCPRCAEPAVVTTKLPKYTLPIPDDHNSVCRCNFCGFLDSGSANWAGYVQGFVSRPCGNCGSSIFHTTEPIRKPYKTTPLTCEACKKEREYEIRWYRYRNDKATDPYFGFDLLLQTSIKNNPLWFYNLDHLEYLKEYVEAKLREDDGRHKYSMITNLPTWVKSAKNRAIIVRKLNQLKQAFEKKTLRNG
jgi:hypothetical protein